MRNCVVCEENGSKYKCPTCKQPYCSLACCKKHKDHGCQPPEPSLANVESEKPQTTYDFPSEDTVPPEKLELLRKSEELKDCLKNPHVRDIMKAVLVDKDPTNAIARAMVVPTFVEMADACLKVVEPSESELC